MHFESRIRNALCHSAAFGRIDRFLQKTHMLLLNVFSATAPYSTQACYNDVRSSIMIFLLSLCLPSREGHNARAEREHICGAFSSFPSGSPCRSLYRAVDLFCLEKKYPGAVLFESIVALSLPSHSAMNLAIGK